MYLIYFYSFTIFSLLIALFLTMWDLKRRSPFFLLWIVIIFLVLVPSFFDPYNRIVTPHDFASTLVISDESLLDYSFYTFLILFSFGVMYIIFNSFFKVKKIVYLIDIFKETKNNNFIFYFLLLLTSIFGFYLFYQQFGFSVLSSLDFTTRREVSSPLAGFLLSYPFMICAGLGCYFFINKNYFNFVISLFLYLILYFVFGGSRQPLIAFILPFAAYYCMRSKELNKKALTLIVLGSVFANFILNALIYLRNLPSFNDRLDAFSKPAELIFNINNREGTEENVRYAYYYFLQNADYQNGYFGFEYLLRSLFFWLPSSLDIFGIKPKDFEYKMFYDYMNGQEGTMHPTIFGSIYADSGWFFVPWVIFLSILLYFLPIYIQRFKGIVYFCLWSTCLFYSFMLARGSIYGSIVILAVALLFGFFVQKSKFRLGLK
ncbi:hypothetical protein P23_3606 [Acinetobacter calcoaceticus]|uniref:O-antigen polymerase n=1 Tax=Acinetobacter calcoaceticus TaxID=471 RepID=UPI00058337F4|nr:O-antigen polymerase [Acinetobacter calcoaceticus]GAM33063.1 hypothetical protein P23_3606 [Acinetobacter calcoaceticus]